MATPGNRLLPQHDRYDYVPLPERRDYSWPDGKRLAFVLTTNVEWFAFGAGLGHDPAKTGEPQTHRNYAWRDYGNRIGIWRLFELLDELKLPAGAQLQQPAVRVRAADHGRRSASAATRWSATAAPMPRTCAASGQTDEERIIREATDDDRAPRGQRRPGAGWARARTRPATRRTSSRRWATST